MDKLNEDQLNDISKNSNVRINTRYNNIMELGKIENICDNSIDNSDNECNESNAFHVLMNQRKQMHYDSPTHQLSRTSDISNGKTKENIKHIKEKLIALADRKGYSKNKLAEAKEGQEIEKSIEKRLKILTGNGKNESIISSVSNHKQSSSNLLNYFSKVPVELKDTDKINVSTFVVKADVHMSDIPSEDHTFTTKPIKTQFSNTIVEDIKHHHEVKDFPISKKYDKPRWALRIKMQPSNEKECLADDIKVDILSPKKEENLKTILMKHSEKTYTNIFDKYDGKNMKRKNDRNGIKASNECTQLKTDRKKMSRKNKNINQDLQIESESVINTMNIKERNEHKNATNIDEDEIICDKTLLKRKSNEKLAPLFVKRYKPDPSVLALRRVFLQSNVIDSNNKSTDQKIISPIVPTLPFPRISHITQLNNGLTSNKLDECNISMKSETMYIPSLNNKNYSCIQLITPKESLIEPHINIGRSPIENMEKILTEIEQKCSDARKIWNTVHSLNKEQLLKVTSPKVKGRKGKVTQRKNIVKEDLMETLQLENYVWTYKYKPMNTEEIVGNEEAAKKLRNWLTGWRSSLTKESNTSGDEFYSSDCSNTTSNENNSVAVLLGPHGSGKSASVYAIAEELGYRVLELNASSKRTGKRILKEFEEATKSHRIKKKKDKTSFTPILKDIFIKKIPQNSLILLEDIDIIFEEDEGFISAVCQLVSNTKRPIIMTSRNTCPYLNKMAPRQTKIYFQCIGGSRATALLELISLAEKGIRLSQDCLTELLQTGDLRKALLQLQYLLLSNFPCMFQYHTNVSTLWQDVHYYLYKPAIKANKKQKTKKSSNTETMKRDNTEINILNNLVNDLDYISMIPSLVELKDSVLNTSYVKIESSLSLEEDTRPYSASQNISAQIAEWINHKVIQKKNKRLMQNDKVQHWNNIILRNKLNKGVNHVLSSVTPATLDNQSISLDYLPYIRAICRAEEYRASHHCKRGNRFFHYLYNLNLPTVSTKSNILITACKILQEKEKKDTHNIDKS